MQLLSTSLRVIINIFDTMRTHLKLQQELFLSFLLDRLVLPLPSTAPGTRKAEVEAQLDLATWASPSPFAPRTHDGDRERERERERDRDKREGGVRDEARELMLEILAQVGRAKFAMVDLWVNYDCDIEGEDLFERFVKFLSRVSRLARWRGRRS